MNGTYSRDELIFKFAFGALNGILIKGGEALETVHQITTVVFDKTGTVTEGSPKVARVRLLTHRWPLPTLIALAASAETNSEHPIAKAIVLFGKNVSRVQVPTHQVDCAVPAHGASGYDCQVQRHAWSGHSLSYCSTSECTHQRDNDI
jgi:cation transport ATPase